MVAGAQRPFCALKSCSIPNIKLPHVVVCSLSSLPPLLTLPISIVCLRHTPLRFPFVTPSRYASPGRPLFFYSVYVFTYGNVLVQMRILYERDPSRVQSRPRILPWEQRVFAEFVHYQRLAQLVQVLSELRIAGLCCLFPHLAWVRKVISLPPILFHIVSGRCPKGAHTALLWVAHEGDSDSLDQTSYKGAISLFELVLLASVNSAGMGHHCPDTIPRRLQGPFDKRVLGEKNICKLGSRVKRDGGQILGTNFHYLFLGGELDRGRCHAVQLGRNGHDPWGRGVGELGCLPHQRKQAVDEQKVSEVIDSKVTIDPIRGYVEFIHANARICDNL